MIYRRVEIVDGETLEPVQFVGVHTLRWPDGYTPTVAFIEDEKATNRLTAADALAEKAKNLIDEARAVPFDEDAGFVLDPQTLAELCTALREYEETSK